MHKLCSHSYALSDEKWKCFVLSITRDIISVAWFTCNLLQRSGNNPLHLIAHCSSPAQALKFNAKRQMRHARQGEPLKMDSIRHLTAGTWYSCEWIRTPKTTVTATSWCTFIWKCDISGGGGTHQTFSFRSISISLATFFCDLNWV